MRLLYTTEDGEIRSTGYIVGRDNIFPYAILSHTYGEQDVVFNDLEGLGSAKDIKVKKAEGWKKIQFCAQQAKRDSLKYFWIDTCCIDKANNAELSEAINSMFRWYQNAAKCYVFLSDVGDQSLETNGELWPRWDAAFRASRWFTRGWTLQELLAPRSVEFFSKDYMLLGNKESLKQIIHEITRIPIQALSGSDLSGFSVAERFLWAQHRHTTREEDAAYCLLGVFGCHLPLIYGEGRESALKRLRKEVLEASNDLASVSANNAERLMSICSWLSAPDPSTNYHKAHKQRKADTGLWLLESPQFNMWRENAASRLWLYGIPGCGKTVLSSTIIRHLLQHCHEDSSIVTVYFYFDFNDPQKQDPELMLRSLLSQLLQSSFGKTKGVDALFSSCENGRRQPSLRAILEVAHEVMQQFTHVYIVLDALDECTQRLNLIHMLETIAMRQPDNMHLLMTSRKERDIESSLGSYIEADDMICLQRDIVDKDILRYVQQSLRDDKRLQKWNKDPDLRQEIEAALVQGACGMFQWAAVQLNTLASCSNRAMLRKSLATLPRTLDQTYDRILTAISEEHCKYAMRILQWLAFSARPLYVEEIAEVVAIDVSREPAFDRNEVLLDPLEALDICSSLVTVTSHNVEGRLGHAQQIITLSHHSVKKYLVSERIKQGPARHFSMQEKECHNAITRGSLGYLNQFRQPITEELCMASALAQYSAEFWNHHLQKIGDEVEELSGLAMSLLSTKNPAYISWLRLYDPDDPGRGPDFGADLDSMPKPLYYGALLGLSMIVGLHLQEGAEVNAQGGNHGNALQAASAKGHEQVVMILIDAGADVNATNGKLGNAIHAAAQRGHVQVVKMLLERGASINRQSGEYGNALQVASDERHEQVVETLVDYGAEPNAQDEHYNSALQATKVKEHSPIVRLLLEHPHANARLVIAPTDSGYASQKQRNSLGPGSTQDPQSQLSFYPKEETSTQISNSCEVDADLDAVQSVDSDHESIGSKIPTDRSKAELFAIKHLASFFAQLEDIRSLHEMALKRIDRRRFTGNYRRILKSYYLRLLLEAVNDTDKEVTKVLRSRQNRESIAEGIADHLLQVEEEEPRPLAEFVAQPSEKQYLENWLRRTQDVHYDRPNEAAQVPVADEYHPESNKDDSGIGFDPGTDSDADSDTDSDTDYGAVSHDFLNISRAENFLQQGSAFRKLVLDIRLLMLPGHLREIVETTPKDSLQLLSENDTSWANTTKASLEVYTGLEWDWWPLTPRFPHLDIEEHYLQWKLSGRTLYLRMNQNQADALREILRIAGDHPSKCHCCTAKSQKALRVTFSSIIKSVFSLLQGYWRRSAVCGGTSSKAAMAYTPSLNSSSGVSSSTLSPTSGGASTSGVTVNNNGAKNATQTQGFSCVVSSPTTQIALTRVIFGIQGVRRSLEIEEVEISAQMNDQTFFSELKTRYKKHRSYFRRLLSPFQFRHCNFVKFQKLNVNRVFSCGEGLPEHDGLAHDYDYSPRHPTARLPLIDPKLFAVCLESCDEDCRWAILGPRLHDCFQLPPLGGRLKCIPKKKSEFAVQSKQTVDDVAWGIEADYALSFFLLSIYHLIPIFSCFAFWIYWQTFHPGDWQNASVPILTTLALMAVFWVPFAYIHGSQLRVGHR